MNTKIKIWDEVFTFTRKDRSPIWHRKVVSITETANWRTVVVNPLYEPEYHAHEETTSYKEELCFLDKIEFRKYLEEQRDKDIQEYSEQVKCIYDGFLNSWKLSITPPS